MSVRTAVIGCGRWGPNHIRVLSSLKGCQVTTVADVDEGRVARVRERFPHVKGVTDYRHALDDHGIDAVVVATPTGSHHAIIRDAIAAGKHVLCEKPLCPTVVEGQELVTLAQQHQRVLMVGHVFLFNPGILKMKELVDAGELGSVYYLSANRVNLGPVRSDVNAAHDLASHDISIFNWMLGSMPDTVSATGASYLQPGIEDVTMITLKYPWGVMAHVQASWLDPKKVRQITVVGDQRMLTWDDLDLATPISVYDKGADVRESFRDYREFLQVSLRDGDVRLPKVASGEPLEIQDRAFIEAVNRGAAERSDGAFGLDVVRVLEAVDASLRLGGSPVSVGNQSYVHTSDRPR
jgi:predicted dehydrogenase